MDLPIQVKKGEAQLDVSELQMVIACIRSI